MSKTPRTNEMLKRYDTLEDGAAGFMLLRQSIEELETELAEALAEVERLKEYTTCTLVTMDTEMDEKDIEIIKRDKMIKQMRDALDATDEYYLDKSYAGEVHNTPIVVKVREAQAALAAAERGD